jgi:hypothetical protein
MELQDIILTCGFVGMAIMYLVSLSSTYYMLAQLKKKFPSEWENLGKPSFFLNNSISNNWATALFIIKKRYKSLDDFVFVSLCSKVRTVFIFANSLGFLWVLVGLLFIWHSRSH